MTFEELFSKRVSRIFWSPIELISTHIKKREGIINFASGLPDPRRIPYDIIHGIIYEVYEKYPKEVLSYPGALGIETLRKNIPKFLKEVGVSSEGKDVVITCGAQHSVTSIARTFLDENDMYAVENPTFVETFLALRFYSENYFPIPINIDSRFDIETLENLLKKIRIKLLYTVPTAQNPTGVTYSDDVRKHIATLSEEHKFIVIEDDPYRFLVEKPPKPISDYTRYGIYVGSFSKIIAPGLRVGFILVPKDIVEDFAKIMQLDFATHPISMYVISTMIERGILQSLVKRLRVHYYHKLKVALNALEDYMPDVCQWSKPQGSFHIFVKAKGINAKQLLEKALKRGVSFIPGDAFYINNPDTSSFRISISYPPEEEIEKGIRILANLIKDLI